MKTAIRLLLLIVGLNSLAMAEEGPIQTLTKAPTSLVINGSNQFSLSEIFALALQHEENERLAITQSCENTVENATTRLEKCLVMIAKSQLGQLSGTCGEFGKGTYFFRFVRANVAGKYQVSGDIDLEISRR